MSIIDEKLYCPICVSLAPICSCKTLVSRWLPSVPVKPSYLVASHLFSVKPSNLVGSPLFLNNTLTLFPLLTHQHPPTTLFLPPLEPGNLELVPLGGRVLEKKLGIFAIAVGEKGMSCVCCKRFVSDNLTCWDCLSCHVLLVSS